VFNAFTLGILVLDCFTFFTVGLCGIGQLLDLILIPGMVERRNIYLRGLRSGNTTPSVNQSITVNLGDIPQLKQL